MPAARRPRMPQSPSAPGGTPRSRPQLAPPAQRLGAGQDRLGARPIIGRDAAHEQGYIDPEPCREPAHHLVGRARPAALDLRDVLLRAAIAGELGLRQAGREGGAPARDRPGLSCPARREFPDGCRTHSQRRRTVPARLQSSIRRTWRSLRPRTNGQLAETTVEAIGSFVFCRLSRQDGARHASSNAPARPRRLH